ncbi:MAG: DUF3494 domain-containing protein, partial [Frankiales bacterium]|nr:DUF3494 domain-containing protein [Frankiales bacterium]
MAMALSLMAGVASAYWSAGSVPGGNGASAAASVNRGATPTVLSAGGNVTVSWAASTLSTGGPVGGYVIHRYAAVGLAPQIVAAACAGTLTGLSCLESAVPDGAWVYSVTPVLGTSWRGAESAKSNVVTTSSTLPVNAISTSVVTGNAFQNGATIFYRGVAPGSFALVNAVTSSGPGPASSTTAALGGDAAGWSHTPSTVSSPSAGPYVSPPFSWTAGTASAPTQVVTARDVAGNSATTTVSLVNDSTSPTPGTISYPDGYQPALSVVVTFSSGTDAGSGIATRQLQRSAAPLVAGSCGIFTGFTDIGASNPTSPHTDNAVVDGFCYKYRYITADQVSNQDVAASASVAKVLSCVKCPVLGSLATYSVLGATGITNGGATTISGDLGLAFSGAIAGFPPGLVAGVVHDKDVAAAQAQADLTLAYNDAAARGPATVFSADNIGRTYFPGVYRTAAVYLQTGNMTLDAQGDPNAVFIFQINAAMSPAAGASLVLINGAQPSHVFWQVNGAADTGAGASWAGTIMANGAITLGAGSTLIG